VALFFRERDARSPQPRAVGSVCRVPHREFLKHTAQEPRASSRGNGAHEPSDDSPLAECSRPRAGRVTATGCSFAGRCLSTRSVLLEHVHGHLAGLPSRAGSSGRSFFGVDTSLHVAVGLIRGLRQFTVAAGVSAYGSTSVSRAPESKGSSCNGSGRWGSMFERKEHPSRGGRPARLGRAAAYFAGARHTPTRHVSAPSPSARIARRALTVLVAVLGHDRRVYRGFLSAVRVLRVCLPSPTPVVREAPRRAGHRRTSGDSSGSARLRGGSPGCNSCASNLPQRKRRLIRVQACSTSSRRASSLAPARVHHATISGDGNTTQFAARDVRRRI